MTETEQIEYKRSISELKEGIISIAAILNKHRKGFLYFGLNHEGNSTKQKFTEKTLRDISQKISNHIEPKIFPGVEMEDDYVKIRFEGNDAPYFAYGRAYIRVADEDRQLSAKELEKMIINKNKDDMAWDKEKCREAGINDISAIKLKSFLKKAGKKFDNVENSLKKLNLISRGKLLNTAVILFARKPEKFFPNAKLRCAVFGETTAVTIDMQEFSGDLFSLIEKAEKYILENIHIGMKVDGLYRVDIPEINKEAFREAIINAFCHRDYYLYDSVNVAVFKDRVEIRSPGKLYGELTIEKIREEEVSERRNELIAEMFHQVRFVEKWGRGINLILSKEPTADFREVGRQFIAVFKRKNVGENVGENVGKKLSKEERKKQIIRLLKLDKNHTILSLSKKLNVNPKTIERDLQELQDKVKYVGSAKGGYWKVLK